MSIEVNRSSSTKAAEAGKKPAAKKEEPKAKPSKTPDGKGKIALALAGLASVAAAGVAIYKHKNPAEVAGTIDGQAIMDQFKRQSDEFQQANEKLVQQMSEQLKKTQEANKELMKSLNEAKEELTKQAAKNQADIAEQTAKAKHDILQQASEGVQNIQAQTGKNQEALAQQAKAAAQDIAEEGAKQTKKVQSAVQSAPVLPEKKIGEGISEAPVSSERKLGGEALKELTGAGEGEAKGAAKAEEAVKAAETREKEAAEAATEAAREGAKKAEKAVQDGGEIAREAEKSTTGGAETLVEETKKNLPDTPAEALTGSAGEPKLYSTTVETPEEIPLTDGHTATIDLEEFNGQGRTSWEQEIYDLVLESERRAKGGSVSELIHKTPTKLQGAVFEDAEGNAVTSLKKQNKRWLLKDGSGFNGICKAKSGEDEYVLEYVDGYISQTKRNGILTEKFTPVQSGTGESRAMSRGVKVQYFDPSGTRVAQENTCFYDASGKAKREFISQKMGAEPGDFAYDYKGGKVVAKTKFGSKGKESEIYLYDKSGKLERKVIIAPGDRVTSIIDYLPDGTKKRTETFLEEFDRIETPATDMKFAPSPNSVFWLDEKGTTVRSISDRFDDGSEINARFNGNVTAKIQRGEDTYGGITEKYEVTLPDSQNVSVSIESSADIPESKWELFKKCIGQVFETAQEGGMKLKFDRRI